MEANAPVELILKKNSATKTGTIIPETIKEFECNINSMFNVRTYWTNFSINLSPLLIIMTSIITNFTNTILNS
jgi:hypothetical protein